MRVLAYFTFLSLSLFFILQVSSEQRLLHYENYDILEITPDNSQEKKMETINSWTKEKLLSAIQNEEPTPQPRFAERDIPPSSFDTLPTYFEPFLKFIGSNTDLAKQTTGKVFYTKDEINYSCSANVVVCPLHGDMIWTAGHCALGNITNFIFIPNFSENNFDGYGMFTARKIYVSPQYVGNNPTWDYAMVLLDTLDGKHIQDIVGAQGAVFNINVENTTLRALGYPSEFENGLNRFECSGPAEKKGYTELGLYCPKGSEGLSGGAVLVNCQPNGACYQCSVPSFLNKVVYPDYFFFPYFGNEALAMYRAICSNTTHTNSPTPSPPLSDTPSPSSLDNPTDLTPSAIDFSSLPPSLTSVIDETTKTSTLMISPSNVQDTTLFETGTGKETTAIASSIKTPTSMRSPRRRTTRKKKTSNVPSVPVPQETKFQLQEGHGHRFVPVDKFFFIQADGNAAKQDLSRLQLRNNEDYSDAVSMWNISLAIAVMVLVCLFL